MTSKKQISFIIILSFILACTPNAHAMRCAIKPLKLTRTTPLKALSLCSTLGKSNDDLKKLQHISESLYNIAPKGCFTDGCENHKSCCLLARNDAEKAKQGKAIRLKEMAGKNDDAYIDILKDTVKRLLLLQQKNVKTQSILLASEDKEAIVPFYKQLCEFTKNVSECLTYSANIYGITFYEASERYYEKNPQGLFNSTKHMTPEEREREKLQDECNRINKALMKSNGYPLNKNILLGWGAHTMDPEYIGVWLDGMEQAMRAHDDYVKNGGGVY